MLLNKDKPPWLNNATMKSSRRKYLAYKKYCKCPNRARYQQYVKERKKSQKLIRSQKESWLRI